MTDQKTGGREIPAFSRVDAAVDRVLQEVADLRARLGESQARSREMEELLERFTRDEEEPSRLLSRLSALEEENRELRARIEQAREGVDRLLARIRFLEEQT